MRWIRKRVAPPVPPIPMIPEGVRIFQIGFNKCGTSSIHAALRDSRIISAHWSTKDGRLLADTILDNEREGRELLCGLEGIVGFSDMENVRTGHYVHMTHYKKLHAAYPRSLFILNIRDKRRWLESRLRHEAGTYMEVAKTHLGTDEDGVLRRWSEQWDAHLADVRAFFREHPDQLLVFDIETDPFDKFVDFFARKGIYIRGKMLPWCNATRVSQSP